MDTGHFLRLSEESEKFVRAAPLHYGARPLGNLAEEPDAERVVNFGTWAFDGIFSVSEEGVLLPHYERSDFPEFVKDHPEIELYKSGITHKNIHDLGNAAFCLPLFRPGFKIYGHWLIDILPRISNFRKLYPELQPVLLLLDETPKWAVDLIHYFFENEFAVKYVNTAGIYRGKLFLSTPFRYHDFLSSHSISLGRVVKEKDEIQTPGLPEKIYIARADNSSGRKLSNKKALEEFLEAAGFVTIYPEKLSLAEQVHTFRAARVIIGEAGSGLHNNVFATRDAKVFIVQSSSQPHLIQSGLCRHTGQEAVYIWAQGETADWFSPYTVEIAAVWNAMKDVLGTPFPTQHRKKATMFTYIPKDGIFGPIHYIEFMKMVDVHCRPSSYFEIGTETGASAAAFSCATVCVDPQFKLSVDVIGQKSSLHLFQMTSDSFFDKIDLKNIFGKGPDVSFLDGMHRFEYLLRDFINIERLCHRRSSVMIHDCYPRNTRMALRQHLMGDETEHEDTRFGWTGDVWKIVPILKKYRPDLSIVIADVPPSGLVVVNNLDHKSDVLENSYFQIIEEFRSLDLNEYGVENLWKDFPFLSAQKIFDHPDELTTFFPHG